MPGLDCFGSEAICYPLAGPLRANKFGAGVGQRKGYREMVFVGNDRMPRLSHDHDHCRRKRDRAVRQSWLVETWRFFSGSEKGGRSGDGTHHE